jgi:hypothetical protein
MIKNISLKRILIILIIQFSIVFCGGNRLFKSEKNQPFISEEFPKLTKIESPKDTIIYRYTNPSKDVIILSSDKFRNKNKTLEIFTFMNNKALDQIFNLSILPIFNN